MNERTDKVWVGNLGAYNEGRLVGDWLELPYDEGSLGDWLREHADIGKPRWDGGTYEECEVFDTDFDGPLGRIGTQTRDLHHLGLPQLNTLARIAAELNEAQMDAAMACIEANGHGQALEAANAMLQADDISFAPFPQNKPARHHYGSDAQALDRSGALDYLEMSDETLVEYIDPRKVGEEEEQCGVFGDGVFVDTAASEEPDDMDREDIISAAERSGTLTTRRAMGEAVDGLTEEAKAILKGYHLFPEQTHAEIDLLLEGDPELGIACADVIAEMDVRCPAAVEAYFAAECTESTPPSLAVLILQADKISYTELGGERKWDESQWDADVRRLGEAVIEQVGDTFSRQELERYFDGERYAQDLLTCGEFTVTEHGVLDNNATDVDLGKHSWDEVLMPAQEADIPEEAR